MSHKAFDNVCVTWRKGLRRTLDLPFYTHSHLVAAVCNVLPLRDKLICRYASFMSTYFSNDNSVVKFIARNDVYFMRMSSPLGINAQLCCDYYGLSQRIVFIRSLKLAWSMFYRNSILPELDKIHTIKELLCVKFSLVSLPLFDARQIDFILESLCAQ